MFCFGNSAKISAVTLQLHFSIIGSSSCPLTDMSDEDDVDVLLLGGQGLHHFLLHLRLGLRGRHEVAVVVRLHRGVLVVGRARVRVASRGAPDRARRSRGRRRVVGHVLPALHRSLLPAGGLRRGRVHLHAAVHRHRGDWKQRNVAKLLGSVTTLLYKTPT